MKVSLRATYGIMAAVDLAMHFVTAPVQAKSIARRQAIPARFLEQVLYGMKKAGLVSSLRGAQGGYILSKKPSDVSVVEILEALDGPLLPLRGRPDRAEARRLSKQELLLGKVWEQVYRAERGVLEAISVEELAEGRVGHQDRGGVAQALAGVAKFSGGTTPRRVITSGDIDYWQDGRKVSDNVCCIGDYELSQRETAPAGAGATATRGQGSSCFKYAATTAL